MLTLNNREVTVLLHLLRAVDAQDERAEEIYDYAQGSLIGRPRNESDTDEGDPEWMDAEAELGRLLEKIDAADPMSDPMGDMMGRNV